MWCQGRDGECSAQVCGVGGDRVAIINSVRDLIADNVSIGFFRCSPSENDRIEIQRASGITHTSWI